MKKPIEEMSEEEKFRLKDYEVKEQRLNEEKDKIRKNLESDLKKLRIEIIEYCQKYDDMLMILFKRRLEYDERIAEQQLYIIRLVLSILIQNQSVRELG